MTKAGNPDDQAQPTAPDASTSEPDVAAEPKSGLVPSDEHIARIKDAVRGAEDELEKARAASEAAAEHERAAMESREIVERVESELSIRAGKGWEELESLRSAVVRLGEQASEVEDQLTRRAAEADDWASQRKEEATAGISAIEEAKERASAGAAQIAEAAVSAVKDAEAIATHSQSAADSAGKLKEILTSAIKSQAEIVQKNEFAEQGLDHIRKAREGFDEALSTANDSAQQASTLANKVGEAAETAAMKSKELDDVLNKAKSSLGVAEDAATRSEEHADSLEEQVKRAGVTESRLETAEETYQTQLAQLKELTKKVEDLLPGAASAGLASAFDKRSKFVKRPYRLWTGAFLFSVALIVVYAVWYGYETDMFATTPDWQTLMRSLLSKLPVIAPLVWLAIHCARQASLAKRLEEEYAFKAAVSQTLEGYRREFAAANPNDPACVVSFLSAVRDVICRHPGDIYDRHRMDPTPLSEARGIVKNGK